MKHRIILHAEAETEILEALEGATRRHTENTKRHNSLERIWRLFVSSLCLFVALLLRREAPVDRLEPHVGFDEAGAPGVPFGRETFLLNLLESFLFRHLLLHKLSRFLKHSVIGL